MCGEGVVLEMHNYCYMYMSRMQLHWSAFASFSISLILWHNMIYCVLSLSLYMDVRYSFIAMLRYPAQQRVGSLMFSDDELFSLLRSDKTKHLFVVHVQWYTVHVQWYTTHVQ